MFLKLYAVIWRDIKVAFGNINSIVSNFILPSMLLVIFAVGMSSSFHQILYKSMRVNYFDFFFPGLIGIQLVFVMTLICNSLIVDNDHQITAMIAFSKITMNHYYWGKYIASLIIVLLRVVFLYIIAVLFFRFQIIAQIDNLILIISSLAIGVFFFYNLGFIIGGFIKISSVKEVLINILPTLFIFTSNSYYNTDQLPVIIKQISIINPLVYVVKNLRDAILLTEIEIAWQSNTAVLLFSSFLLCPIALLIKNNLIYKR
jgi:ABC-2 type transport system permease protein